MIPGALSFVAPLGPIMDAASHSDLPLPGGNKAGKSGGEDL
jgi:hypothetical protein